MSEFYIFFSLLFFLNILIIFNIDKINKFVNIYDVPDSKIKLHKKKNCDNWRFNSFIEFYIMSNIISFIKHKFVSLKSTNKRHIYFYCLANLFIYSRFLRWQASHKCNNKIIFGLIIYLNSNFNESIIGHRVCQFIIL